MSTDCCYTEKQKNILEYIYIVSIFIWIFICFFCGITRKITLMSIFLIISPIVILFIAYSNIGKINKNVEKLNSQTNFISLGLLVAIPLLSWIKTQKESESRVYEERSILIFIVFTMISPLDVWVSEEKQAYVLHIKSISQIFLLFLLIAILVEFFTDKVSIK